MIENITINYPENEAEGRFLGEFNVGSDILWFDDKDFYKTKIYTKELGNLKKHFNSLVKKSYVERMNSAQIVELEFKLTELKEECKKRGLKTSGKKIVLAQQLVDYDPDFVKLCNAKSEMWICTEEGRKIVKSYYDQKKQCEVELQEFVFRCVKEKELPKAASAVEAYRNQQLFSDWFDISDERNPLRLNRELEESEIICSEIPFALKKLSAEYLDKARALAVYDRFRGTNCIRKYGEEPTNVEGLSLGKAVQVFAAYASAKVYLKEIRGGCIYGGVKIMPISKDLEVCPECQKLVGKIYSFNKNIPVIPNEKCINPAPCTLTYFAVMENQMDPVEEAPESKKESHSFLKRLFGGKK